MRLREFNFSIAIAVSVAAHLLLWPAAKHLRVPAGADGGADSRAARTRVTLILNGDASELPRAEFLPPIKPPEVDSPEDEMGEAKGKGTGAQSAKGKQPLTAREADQDQAFLGRHPPGSGRTTDVQDPSDDIRGKNGSGGQRGGPQVAPAPPTPIQSQAPSVTPKVPDEVHDAAREPAVEPRHSPLKQPTPVENKIAHDDKVAPPPSKTASVGAASAVLSKPPVDAVKPKGPLVQTAAPNKSSVPAAPEPSPTVVPVPASSTAPPAPGATPDRQSVVVAPQLPLPKAVVATPPPPSIEKSRDKAKTPTPPKEPAPPVQVASAAPALVNTGDGRAPGHDAVSPDPSQESESESDPFSKHAVSALFHDGKLEIRDGRKVETRRRPDFRGLGAQAAFLTIPNPDVVLKIWIDATGKVTNVDLAKSCGSIDLDLPCQLAAYYWWIEPSHDKKGRPIPDVILFTISIR